MASDVSSIGRYVPLVLTLLLGCSGPSPQTFEHDFTTGATPWTHDDFDDGEGKFTFAIFSDLNGGERSPDAADARMG